MKWKDYSWLIKNFEPSINKEGKIFFVSKTKNANNEKKLKLLLDKYDMNNMLPLEFTNRVNKILHIRSAEELVRKSLALKFISMNIWDIIKLSDDKKSRYLDAILPETDTVSEDTLKKILNDNKENIQVSLYTLKIPEEFIKKEQKKLDKFCKKLYQTPKLKEKISNWNKVKLSDKMELINNISKIFAQIYKIEFVEFKTFDDEQYDVMRKKQGLKKTSYIPVSYHEDNVIYIHEDRLKKSDNYFPITTTFHQNTHIYQNVSDLSAFPVLEKMFDEKFQALEMENDLHLLNLRERHAYLMQFELEKKLYNDLGIAKTKNEYDEEYKNKITEMLNYAKTIAYYVK